MQHTLLKHGFELFDKNLRPKNFVFFFKLIFAPPISIKKKKIDAEEQENRKVLVQKQALLEKLRAEVNELKRGGTSNLSASRYVGNSPSYLDASARVRNAWNGRMKKDASLKGIKNCSKWAKKFFFSEIRKKPFSRFFLVKKFKFFFQKFHALRASINSVYNWIILNSWRL